MKTTIKFLFIVFFAFIATMNIYSQEWTKAQNEVWQRVESEWSYWKTGDITGMTAILHEKYQGWNTDSPLPMSKAMLVDFFNGMKDSYKINMYSINPARITMTENSAVVDYYYMYNITFGTGEQSKTKETKGRIVEFYVKEGGKWMLLGDMMAEDENEDD